MNKSFLAWAINTNSKEGHGLLGRYWSFGNSHRNIPPHLEGCTTALFKKREIAREALRLMKEDWVSDDWRPAVSRVKVTIEEVRQD